MENSMEKVTEITVNTRRFALKCKNNKKASGSIKALKKFIQKQWKTKLPVYLSEDLNKKIWTRGNKQSVGRIRIRIQKGTCLVNPEKLCYRVSLVEVNSFKALTDAKVVDDE